MHTTVKTIAGSALAIALPLTCWAETLSGALQILGEEVLLPSSDLTYISASLTPAPLSTGVVEPIIGDAPVIDIASISGNPQWFAVVDLHSDEFYQHEVLYVFIDDSDGTVTVVDADDWPMIDGVDFASAPEPDPQPVLVVPLVPRPTPIYPETPPEDAPWGDYGDAPDGQLAYIEIPGMFPSRFDTTFSVMDRPGAHALTTGLEMLGQAVSVEQGVVDPDDPDGRVNLVDADEDERMYLAWDRNTSPGTAYLIYDVSVAAGAPSVTRYVNVLFDFDRSGHWANTTTVTEWAVVNQAIDVAPGTTETIISPPFDWGDTSKIPVQVWTRVVLSRSTIDPGLFGSDGWDGSGAFDFGEIEDFGTVLSPIPEVGAMFQGVADPDPVPALEPEPGPPGVPGGGMEQSETGPMPAGPEEACDEDVQYFALVVQGKDRNKASNRHVETTAELMEKHFKDQGYETEKLDGADASATGINDWMDAVKEEVRCIDRILIYIVGHGSEDEAGVEMPSGEMLGLEQLQEAMDKIPPCADQPCTDEHVCCDVTIIIDSCYSQQFEEGLKEEGRRVITSAPAEKEAKSSRKSKGGAYSKCYRDAGRDPDADKDPKDGCVDPAEAHRKAKDKLREKYPDAPVPNMVDQTCKCSCDCADRAGREDLELRAWREDFELYPPGPLGCQGGWKGWDDDPACDADVTDAQAHSAPQSLDIALASDLVHEFYGVYWCQWTFTTWMYVPSDFESSCDTYDNCGSYLILLNTYSDGGPYRWSVQLRADSLTGSFIRDQADPRPSLPLITDQWVEVKVLIDLDNDLYQVFYAGQELGGPASWSAGVFGSGDGALNIAAVDLFANGSTSVYYDDLLLEEQGAPSAAGACCLLDDSCWDDTLAGDCAGAGGEWHEWELCADIECASAVLGDLDGDGDMDVDDFYIFADTFGACDGDPEFIAAADYDGDGCITLDDYQTWMACYLGN